MNIKKIIPTALLFSILIFTGSSIASADISIATASESQEATSTLNKNHQQTARENFQKRIHQRRESLFERYKNKIKNFIEPRRMEIQREEQHQGISTNKVNNKIKRDFRNLKNNGELKNKAEQSSRMFVNGKLIKNKAIQNARKEQRRIRLNTKTKEIIQKVSVRITEAFNRALKRFSEIDTKIQQRITFFEKKGFDMTNAKKLLLQIPLKISAAQQKIDGLSIGLSDLTSSENPREAFMGLREKIKDVRASVREVKKGLVNVIRAIKDSIRLKLQQENGTLNQQQGTTTATTN